MGGAATLAGPAAQVISRLLTVKQGKSAGELVVEQAIQRVQLTVLSPLGKSEYDSENSFERDAVAAALGQRYDPYIRKAYPSKYASQGGSTPAPDPKFESIWNTNVPPLSSVALVQGILLPHLPTSLLPGKTWVDSVRTGGNTTVNQYRVVKKEGDQLQLALTSQLATGNQPNQSGSAAGGVATATSALTKADYEGELRVRLPSGFIEELHLTKHSVAVVNAAGQTLSNETRAKLDIVNTMQ